MKTLTDFRQTVEAGVDPRLENMVNSRKNGNILSSYTENTLYCSDVYNLAQKLDNSVQIVKINGHA